jgi:tetratricopeptide (TPR) repeat protein
LSKRKRKKPGDSFGVRRKRPTAIDLDSIFKQADRLISRGSAREAVSLLKPVADEYPHVAELQYYLGYAYAKAGEVWASLSGYERALELSRDPGYWLPLGSLYVELGLNVHALHAFRQVLKRGVDVPNPNGLRQAVAGMEADVAATAEELKLSTEKMEQGLRAMEEGQRALQQGAYRASIARNRKAIQLLGDWPPPHNNLSLAQFFDGQPQEAIAAARRVLAQDPDNLQALANAIRFLAWTGQEAEARALWPRLQPITPHDDKNRIKKAEAAAVLGEDESVYKLLQPLDAPTTRLQDGPVGSWQVQLFLAVAEANTARHKPAQRRLRALKESVPWAGDLLAALQAGQPGPGWASRYPYFHSSELVPREKLEEWLELHIQKDRISPKQFQRRTERLATSYPQFVLMAEKMIIEENQADAGTMLLAALGTSEAYAALRRFGLSQIGDDEARMQALFRLLEAGQIAPNESLRVWHDGAWQEVQLRGYEVTDEPEAVYSPKVADLINRGMEALRQNKEKQAESLLSQAVKLEPRAKEAYNNLAVIYGRLDEHERAKEMYRKAIEIDPLYVFPRANLTLYLLHDGDLKGAEEMLAPLADASRFTPQEMAFYAYAQARVAMHKEEYDKARNSLEMALEVLPDYEPAHELLERLEQVSQLRSGWERFMQQQSERWKANRARLQTKLSTLQPSLVEALPLYSKDVLTGMGREIILGGGWSTLRKAELAERLVEELNDAYNLERIVNRLSEAEREALRQVLAGGGHMDWQQFTARYDSDTEESPYWQYHAPESLMGRLRLRGLLVEATVDNRLLVVIPAELRQLLAEILEV